MELEKQNDSEPHRFKTKSPLRLTAELGADFWNDSCSLQELSDAIRHGATGATSNPVIVASVVKNGGPIWNPVLDRIIEDFPYATEDDISWKLIEGIGVLAAQLLWSVFDKTQGQKGFLSMQVNPKYYRDAEKMYDHGKRLASLAPNIAIKAPCTRAGIEALEQLTADGINVNATVSFSVSQAVEVARALERGIQRAKDKKLDISKLHPYVTIMMGRLEDHLGRVAAAEGIAVETDELQWAGVAVFKKAHEVFKREGFRSTLLGAAYRHQRHWTEIIGENVLMTMPYSWWKQFNESTVVPLRTLETPVDQKILQSLKNRFVDFSRAYEEESLKIDEFVSFGPTIHTLNQFLTGYQDLLGLVRERMLR